MIIAETQVRTSQLVILCTQWDYRLFEILNEVQVNVFRLVAVLIITFFNWCEAVTKHIRTNGWLHIR